MVNGLTEPFLGRIVSEQQILAPHVQDYFMGGVVSALPAWKLGKIPAELIVT